MKRFWPNATRNARSFWIVSSLACSTATDVAGITACVFLIQSIKARKRITQLQSELAAGQSELKSSEDASAALKSRLEQTLIELERFREVLDAETEAARILDKTRAEVNQPLQQAQAKVMEADSRLNQAIASAESMQPLCRPTGKSLVDLRGLPLIGCGS